MIWFLFCKMAKFMGSLDIYQHIYSSLHNIEMHNSENYKFKISICERSFVVVGCFSDSEREKERGGGLAG